MSDLQDLARNLIKNGPAKSLTAAPRRIRIVFNGVYVADTRNAKFVWESTYYPQLYLPWSDFEDENVIWKEVFEDKGFEILQLDVGSKKTDRIIRFFRDVREELRGLVKVDFKAMDAWYEEDTPILVHPKDPFKRVDVIPSSAVIKVGSMDTVLAEAPFAMHLYETSLPVRYYLPMTSINQSYLRPSAKGTRTECPYKGEAEYYDVVLKHNNGEEEVFPDLAWFYTNPNLECAGIKGMACFYNEKVDVWIDGKKEETPKTHFA